MMEPAAGTSTMGSKRQRDEIVDPDDSSVIQSSKKARAEIDTDKKLKVLKFLIQSHNSIFDSMFKASKKRNNNITLGNQITNIIFSCFNILRQRSKMLVGNVEKRAVESKTFTVTTEGRKHTIPIEIAITLVKAAATSNGLEFKTYLSSDKSNWYGTAGPYLDFFAGNALRLTELRLGHTNMPISKQGDKTTLFPVSKYGINGSHHILLEGSTFPPEKRASMAQSVGPLTAVLCHIRTKGLYREKWTMAAKRALAHIPFIDEILNAIQDKPAAEIRGLIGTLADILLITTSRQAQRMFFPLNILAYIYATTVNEEGYLIEDSGMPSKYKGGDEWLQAFNVSGNGGFYTYDLCRRYKWKMEGKYTPLRAAQVLFHTIFGTYKEDLTILEQITDLGTWERREEFGDSFKRDSDGGNIVEFAPVVLKYYSKLSSANQTGLLASSYSQVCSIPVFSGVRSQHYTNEFFEQLDKRAGITYSGKTIPQLTSTLTDLLADLRKKLMDGGKRMSMGTVLWRKVEDMDMVTGGEALKGWSVEGNCKFFLGS